LKRAIKRLDVIYNEVEDLYRESKVTTSLCELRNMVNVAHLIIHQSLERKENKGGYFNSDNIKVVVG
jgi:L-aspartate oxidase